METDGHVFFWLESQKCPFNCGFIFNIDFCQHLYICPNSNPNLIVKNIRKFLSLIPLNIRNHVWYNDLIVYDKENDLNKINEQ